MHVGENCYLTDSWTSYRTYLLNIEAQTSSNLVDCRPMLYGFEIPEFVYAKAVA